MEGGGRGVQSELEDVRDIVPKTRDELLNSLKSVKKIREAELETLIATHRASKSRNRVQSFQRK